MDGKAAPAVDRPFAWLPTAMPGVAQLFREKRQRYGVPHVAECWARGMAGEPGWFFAREGAIAIGTPWKGDPVMADFAAAQIAGGQALLIMREPGREADR